jgi:hypothetical protein
MKYNFLEINMYCIHLLSEHEQSAEHKHELRLSIGDCRSVKIYHIPLSFLNSINIAQFLGKKHM